MIGQRIREARERAGLTRFELSLMTGLRVGWLENYERGRATPPSSHLIHLAEALGVRIDCFLRPPDDEWPVTPR